MSVMFKKATRLKPLPWQQGAADLFQVIGGAKSDSFPVLDQVLCVICGS